jgi:hypothetical protein
MPPWKLQGPPIVVAAQTSTALAVNLRPKPHKPALVLFMSDNTGKDVVSDNTAKNVVCDHSFAAPAVVHVRLKSVTG